MTFVRVTLNPSARFARAHAHQVLNLIQEIHNPSGSANPVIGDAGHQTNAPTDRGFPFCAYCQGRFPAAWRCAMREYSSAAVYPCDESRFTGMPACCCVVRVTGPAPTQNFAVPKRCLAPSAGSDRYVADNGRLSHAVAGPAAIFAPALNGARCFPPIDLGEGCGQLPGEIGALPRPDPNGQRRLSSEGSIKLDMTSYSTRAVPVDTVFFAVVPDSFMTRSGAAGVRPEHAKGGADWPEEVDRPLVSPHDRWSF